MKTGIELIAEERHEQLTKHGRTIEADSKYNHGKYEERGEEFNRPQLAMAASQLVIPDEDPFRLHFHHGIFIPHGWNEDRWFKMMNKTYKERLIIAGALIAAEIDRLAYEEQKAE